MVDTYAAAISAHRGGAEHATAETWAAYHAALGTGAEYVEFDVRRTRDGELVVHHDERIGTGGPAVARLSYPELCSASGYDVPRVADLMRLLANRAIGHIDLKEAGYEEQVVLLADRILGSHGYVVTSRHARSIAAIKRRVPEATTALTLTPRPADVPVVFGLRAPRPFSFVRATGADLVAVHHSMAVDSILNACAAAGIGAMVWTVNSERRIRRLMTDPRVSVVITDRPQHAVGLRGRRRPMANPVEFAAR